MKLGIITKHGKFIPCHTWEHHATALWHQTEDQFIHCTGVAVEVWGRMNEKMEEAVFKYCEDQRVNIELVMGSCLEAEFKIKEKLGHYLEE